MDIGEKVKRLRKSMGLTQTELGEKIGVQKNAVSKWETNRVIIPTSTIKALAELFQVPTSYLIDDNRIVTNDDIKFALWGDCADIDDEDLNDVRRYAAFIRERKKTLK